MAGARARMWSQWMRLEASHFGILLPHVFALHGCAWLCIYVCLCVHDERTHVYPFPAESSPHVGTSRFTQTHTHTNRMAILVWPPSCWPVGIPSSNCSCRLCRQTCICVRTSQSTVGPPAVWCCRFASKQRKSAQAAVERAGYLLCAHSFVTNGKIQFSCRALPRARVHAAAAAAAFTRSPLVCYRNVYHHTHNPQTIAHSETKPPPPPHRTR